MTKPIEGWVAWHESDLPIADLESLAPTKEGCMESLARLYAPAIPDNRWKARPVRITFTDEYEAVTKYKHLDLVRNDQYDKQVEEALREERERIWKAAWEVWPNWYPDLKQIIFGEEK